ncbi:MAG: alpha-D-ribose 1-methylphosphonate 5-triphosphate diphosphatase [Rhizobiales bacterium]|nr:alpha-D-ribose 1-methylphosphonate 5-triphosphate diphosphatase [Hyphomicrobiales bacterium]
MDLRIEGGRALVDGGLMETTIDVTSADGGVVTNVGQSGGSPPRLDAHDLLVLPGIVDIHGDAFERQMMPRPGVDFPIDVALIDTDRQVVANGITTVFHGVTWSWEPGLRGPENARAILESIERLRPQFAADTRFHLRHETYNLDAEAEISEWLAGRRIGLLAFNDHMTLTVEASNRIGKKAEMAKRSGLSEEDFDDLVERVKRRSNEVPGSIVRLAEAAVASGVPLLSHDDTSPVQRRWFGSLGCRIAEFPTTIETTREAASQGDHIVFGAPNVVRGGSHTGWTSAAEMVESGLCSILASDYYYPAPLLAAFRLASDNIVPLEKAWTLVSEAPAAAVGLTDRGRVAGGQRADLILVDARESRRPRVIATIVAGRIVHLANADRLYLS